MDRRAHKSHLWRGRIELALPLPSSSPRTYPVTEASPAPPSYSDQTQITLLSTPFTNKYCTHTHQKHVMSQKLYYLIAYFDGWSGMETGKHPLVKEKKTKVFLLLSPPPVLKAHQQSPYFEGVATAQKNKLFWGGVGGGERERDGSLMWIFHSCNKGESVQLHLPWKRIPFLCVEGKSISHSRKTPFHPLKIIKQTF